MHVHIPDALSVHPHKRIPLLLVTNSREPRCDLVVLHDLFKPLEPLVLRVNRLRMLDVARGVLMSRIGDGLVGQRAQIRERGVHLRRSALEEPPAPRDEQRVAREDATGVRAVGRRCIVAYGVLRVAGCRETSAWEDEQGAGVLEATRTRT